MNNEKSLLSKGVSFTLSQGSEGDLSVLRSCGVFTGRGGETSSRVKVIIARKSNIRGSSQQNFTGSEMAY